MQSLMENFIEFILDIKGDTCYDIKCCAGGHSAYFLICTEYNNNKVELSALTLARDVTWVK